MKCCSFCMKWLQKWCLRGDMVVVLQISCLESVNWQAPSPRSKIIMRECEQWFPWASRTQFNNSAGPVLECTCFVQFFPIHACVHWQLVTSHKQLENLWRLSIVPPFLNESKLDPNHVSAMAAKGEVWNRMGRQKGQEQSRTDSGWLYHAPCFTMLWGDPIYKWVN